MYLKFISEFGHVTRYNEVKKRVVLGKVRDFQDFSQKKYTIEVNKRHIDITSDIKLLHDILTIDFKSDIYTFESVFNYANIYVANTQLYSRNILVMFGSSFLDLKTRQFYSIQIVNGNVLLQNAKPVDPPHFYTPNKNISTS